MMSKISRGLNCPFALFATIGLLMLACAESSDSGGMSGTGLSQGTIDSFGSIFVNGVEWETAAASVDLDGVPAGEGDLRLGMVVTVRGNLESGGQRGTATSVSFDDEVEGPIENTPMLVGPGGTRKQFSVLGRQVLVDAVSTVFAEGADFATIARDDVVEVSGLVDGSGTILATRLELRGVFPTVTEVELEGVVANLARNGDGTGLFDLGPITVEYYRMTDFVDLIEEDLSNGTIVEVKGSLVGGGTTRIDADRIELEDDFDGDDIPEFELEGVVANLARNGDGTGLFDLGPITVEYGTMTDFVDLTEADLANGTIVEAEGELVSGVLIADEVELEGEDLDDARLDAAISAIDSGARTVTLLGVVVEVDASTELEDDRDEHPNFGFEDLMVGDWVALRGFRTGAGMVTATRLERQSPETDVELEGPVTALDRMGRTLEILDQPIPIDAGTLYFDSLDQLRTETEFFEDPGDVELGDIVRARDEDAVDDSALLEADEVEIEFD